MDLVGKLEIAGYTDTGMKRQHNEDSIGTELEMGLVVLADGMGGYKAGEVASALAVNTVVSELSEHLEMIAKGDIAIIDGERGYSMESLALEEVTKKSNSVIYTTQKHNEECKGMGTTVVSALFYDNRISIAHVGDSRIYRVRDGQLEQISKDHTLLQELVDRGFYTPEEARVSLNKNLVTRALGVDADVEVDIQEDIAFPNDIYLLCSDGLNDMVEDKDIYLTIKEFSDNLQKAAQELVKRANDNGGKDNISVILVRPLKPFPAKKGWMNKVSNWFF
jgi:protein phosphatase